MGAVIIIMIFLGDFYYTKNLAPAQFTLFHKKDIKKQRMQMHSLLK